ncbi:HAD family hydrolase [Falsibacillus pallidus]|uniref:Phosphoglycolate phosphatase n=1 Tax=Falsibacillus pallidus TaxID=493781 RepID=A0A370G4I0_9BACI|nr:HAD family hydrolase [Falsibacillus pallidus]RDI37936.1 phosphoglycolate phosphatase [Falsibacillus pallidus]
MDSIIFDLDGTLWDSRETVLEAWNEKIEQHEKLNQPLTAEDFKQTMGLQMKEIGEILFPSLSAEEREVFLQECCDSECDYLKKSGGSVYENVEEVLNALSKKYKLFIVSNCQAGYIESFYDYHKLDPLFLDFENPGRTGLSKGENIKLIMERNHLESPVYVGDTEGDRKASESAGIPFVYARYGFGEVEKYDYVIDEFRDLLRLF